LGLTIFQGKLTDGALRESAGSFIESVHEVGAPGRPVGDDRELQGGDFDPIFPQWKTQRLKEL
jgi:hypothetical protein